MAISKRTKEQTTNYDLQNTTQKIKDWETQTPQKKVWGEIKCSGKVSGFNLFSFL